MGPNIYKKKGKKRVVFASLGTTTTTTPPLTSLQTSMAQEEEKQVMLPEKSAAKRFSGPRRCKTDIHMPHGYNPFAITISPAPPGYDREEVKVILDWHSMFDQVLLVSEDRSDGTEHYHSLVTTPVKQAHTLTKQLLRLFKKEGLEVTDHVTIKVKSCPEPIGWMHYLMKEVPEHGAPMARKGWALSWIKETLLANLKKRPHKMLLKDVYHLSKKTGTRMVCEYASARSLPLDSKFAFCRVCTEMMKDGYQFDSVALKWVYAQVSAIRGNEAKAMDMLMCELRFLE